MSGITREMDNPTDETCILTGDRNYLLLYLFMLLFFSFQTCETEFIVHRKIYSTQKETWRKFLLPLMLSSITRINHNHHKS